MSASFHTAQTRRGFNERIPAARYGTPDEIGNAAVFLGSEGAGYVNGHTLTVDGGFSIAGLSRV
jgi:NAD(P)-dependent dehydrogenase (short-subunit alcohol dehydrogenase family)